MTRGATILATAVLAGAAVQAAAQAQPAPPGDEIAAPFEVVTIAQGGDAVAAFHLAGSTATVVADQVLIAVVSNIGIGAVAPVDGSVRFQTGAAAIDDDAFASFSGIASQSLNTGLNSNVQSAVNVVVSGSLATQSLSAGATR